MRRVLVAAHRWVGLGMAAFLALVGATGALLVWRAELDALLNPDLFRAPPHPAGAATLGESALAAALAARVPGVHVNWVDLPAAPGESARASVGNWPRGAEPARRVNEAFLDPVNGAVLGARSTLTPGFRRAELVPWIRRLHYSLLMKRTGMLIMGGVALAWLVDCFVGLAATLPRNAPRWSKWKQGLQVRRARLNYDLHRAAGLWLWPVFVVLASSSVFLNLTHEVFVPAIETLSRALPQAWRAPFTTAVLEWQYPLHTGEAFGLAGRIIVCAAGVVLVGMVVTGLVTTVRKWTRGRATA